MRRLLWLLTLLPVCAFAAGTAYHMPREASTPTSYAVAGANESGTAWYANGGVWIGCAQNFGYFAFTPSGALAGSGTDHGICVSSNLECTGPGTPYACCTDVDLGTCGGGNCNDCNGGDCEAVAIVGDVLYCLGESSGNIASYNLANWASGNYDFNGLDRLETWSTSALIGTTNGEGMAAVPFTCTGCEANSAFIVSKQDATVKAFTLADGSSSYTDLSPNTAKLGPSGICTSFDDGADWSGLDYDAVNKHLYWTSDANATRLCVATLPTCSESSSKTCVKDGDCTGTCTASTVVVETNVGTAGNDGLYESMATCPACGYVILAGDGTAFRVYPDLYCGDALISADETCDGGNFAGATCASTLGAGNVGHLTCSSDCATITSTQCRTTNPEWYNVAWRNRRKLTIQASQIPDGANLTDFPMLVSYASDAALANQIQADGGDVLFTLTDGTKLDHEIAAVTASTGALQAWVRIPDLDDAADTVIYMYYNNSAAADQWSVDATWASAYVGVYHLEGLDTDTTPDDSSGTGNHLTENGDPAEDVSGKIGRGVGVARGASWLITPWGSGVDTTATDLTICAWFTLADFHAGVDLHLFTHGNQANDRYYYRVEGSGARLACRVGATNPTDDTVSTSLSTWYRACIVMDGSSGTDIYYAYRNATVFTNVNGIAYTGWTQHAADFIFGGATHANTGATGEGFTGTLDEIWVSTADYTAARIAAEYNNQNSPSSFYTTGTDEVRPRRHVD